MSRVLVVRLDNMGDVLLAGPAVRAIAAAGREVWLLAGPQGAAAAELLPGVDRVLTWECPWILDPAPAVTPAGIDRIATVIREAGFDQAVILTSFHQSSLPTAMILRLAGIGRIAGASVDHAGSLLDVRLRPGEDLAESQPEPERALAIAHAAGFELPPGDDGRLRIRATAAPPGFADGDRYVVLHPGASVPARTWPAQRFADTARRLAGAGLRVVVTGGPGERELTRLVAGDAGEDLGGLLDLPALAGLLAGASLLIAGNTGPAHLAAAVGTPVVSLFSPVVPAIKWAPYGVPVELLGDQEAPCRDSRARICPVPGHPCLAGVTPEDVVSACERLLGRAALDQPVPPDQTVGPMEVLS